MELILGIVIFIGDIWAIVNVLRSRSTTGGGKLLWALLILILPVLGLIIWFFAGPRSPKETTASRI
ncbi:MAG TPA: PLDc N-terminal domain-containing protein [Desulfobacteria bacterium]|nr:PLDc N-terminal domain-containing protein [Desulfobacteria bacterium]